MAFLRAEMDPPMAERGLEAWLLWLVTAYAAVLLGLTIGLPVGVLLADRAGLL